MQRVPITLSVRARLHLQPVRDVALSNEFSFYALRLACLQITVFAIHSELLAKFTESFLNEQKLGTDNFYLWSARRNRKFPFVL